MKRKLIKIISLILCGVVLVSGSVTAQCTQNIDKSEKTSYNENASECVYETGSSLSLNKTQLQSEDVSAVIKSPFFIVLVRKTPGFFGKIKTVFLVGSKVKIKSSTGNFCLVESENGTEGHVFKWWLDEKDDKEDDGTLKFNRKFDHVYIDHTNINESTGKPRTQLQPNYSGTVTYSSSNSDIISVDSKTGLITGKKAGTANLKATVDGETVSIPVYCIYKWKKGWTGKASKSTTVYSGPSNSTTALTTISSGTKFYVTGDDGSSAGWAYGYVNVNNGKKWGFVKINDISTKGTVSQYKYLPISNEDKDKNTYWKWPVITPSGKTNANYIQSPYGKRDRDPTMHKGIDITTGNEGEINGYKVVSAFTGEVVYISTSSSNSTGYCVGVKSDITDPVSGENMIAFYMHLKYSPSVHRWQKVSAGDLLGYVGNTGNSGGYHLHFEANNKNASIGDGSTARQYYAYLINPLFFYIDKTVRINYDSDAEEKYYGSYWYGND